MGNIESYAESTRPGAEAVIEEAHARFIDEKNRIEKEIAITEDRLTGLRREHERYSQALANEYIRARDSDSPVRSY